MLRSESDVARAVFDVTNDVDYRACLNHFSRSTFFFVMQLVLHKNGPRSIPWGDGANGCFVVGLLRLASHLHSRPRWSSKMSVLYHDEAVHLCAATRVFQEVAVSLSYDTPLTSDEGTFVFASHPASNVESGRLGSMVLCGS